VAVIALFGAGIAGCRQPLPAEPHPIIIVDIDTLGAKHLGAYGYARDTSPHLDAFARNAVHFAWAFSQAPNTLPSQASIFTGLYPSTHQTVANDARLPQEVTTLAEVLQANGYRTAAFVDGGFMAAAFGHAQGFDTYQSFEHTGLVEIGPAVRAWIDEHAAELFFLLIHTYDVHWPYDPPEPYRSMFVTGLAPPSPGFEPTAELLESLRRDKSRSLPTNDLEYARARYDGGIRYVDDWLGELLAQLRAAGLMERATIVVLADHGEEFQEHGSVGHDRLYATVTHVPLLLRLPGGRAARIIHQAVETIDLMPTLLELSEIEPPPDLQGRSLVAAIRGARPPSGVAVSESPFFGGQRAVTADDFRLMWTGDRDRVELYQFRQDPDEQRDLSAAHPRRAQGLREALALWQTMVDRSPAHAETDTDIDPGVLESLRSLGYIE
jgi:arylsulfatase A-like enzyme